MMNKTDLLFVLSVDTEEEWDWDGPFPEDNFSVENLSILPKFQKFCETLNIRPCYFVDYAAAKGIPAEGEFHQAIKNNFCELGAHLHPWANPPYFQKPNEENSHVVNLPIQQVAEKLDALLSLFAEKFSYQPKAFRTGRWGISEEIMQLLWSRGFTVDSSVYPFYQNEYFSCQGSPVLPYWPDVANVLKPGSQRNILELPVTVGFNRRPFTLANRIYQAFDSAFMQNLKANAILWHSRILRKIYMSPEVTSSDNMIRLCKAIDTSKQPIVHMYLHSSNLIQSGTGVVDHDDPYQLITTRIKNVIEHLSKRNNLVFMTPSEAKIYFKTNPKFIAT
ncbi:WalW protein [Agaribacter flavus]|uniref:WalW protein n=1 Tax=Agaribacter flavus TaxID=1902781 RepID=A0ABV7FQP9_9ALTE